MFKPYFELNIPIYTDNNSCLCFRCSIPLCDFKKHLSPEKTMKLLFLFMVEFSVQIY